MIEIWKPYKTPRTNIEVSNLGNVRGTICSKPVKIVLVNGRRCINNHHNKIFRLVWIAFNGPIPKDYCIHHIDFNKTNDRLDNLMFMTRSEHTKLHNNSREYVKGKPGPNKGKHFSEETRKKMSFSHKGKPSPARGVKWSEESKEKLKNRIPWNKGKKCINKENKC